MKTRIVAVTGLVVLIILVVAVVVTLGRASPRGFPLSLATVRQLQDGNMSYEVRRGVIVVTLVDRHDDAHVHILDHPGVSQEEALGVLAAKKSELSERCGREREESTPSATARGSEAQVGTMPPDKVHDIASRAARAEGVDLEKFAAPKITFDPETQQWWLFFEGIVEPCPGNYLHVIVDDRTGKASVRGGE